MIVTRHLTRHYGSRIGIEDVDLEVAEGSIFGFLGPNGAGKTTAIRVLLGFLRPGSGQARIFDLDCWRQSAEIKREVGYLPGDLRLYPWMNAREALALVAQVRRRPLQPFGDELVERFRLEPTLRVHRMSRGTRQKLGLVLALAPRPRLVMLDEPTSGLDPLMQVELMRTLRELVAAGHTVFFSSHTLAEVEKLCDRVAVLRDGRVVGDETLAALRGRAERSVRLVFTDAAAAASTPEPPFLRVLGRSGREWECALQGETPHLLAWASHLPLEDISIGPPDLERIFRSFYETESVGRGGAQTS